MGWGTAFPPPGVLQVGAGSRKRKTRPRKERRDPPLSLLSLDLSDGVDHALRAAVGAGEVGAGSVERELGVLAEGVADGVAGAALFGQGEDEVGLTGLRQPVRVPEPTNGPGSARRWRPRTPALAAGLTDHVWTGRKGMLLWVPPGPQPQTLEARGEPDDREGKRASGAGKQSG